ncbi:MAG: hypothetical protein CFH40_02216 [Alphaproteobacteria bacterium MarineAlpha10_Bin3]|jgi:uncharacterized SAM-binding protein YcdF (DUF218 family)|nr:MAG: hypothetical protein CFH40_02216 [Alphaproteobacteria bacterium MarineAlpha10_Bin3]PPR67767.1 MAG: hypothetical protein CFH09_02216 [Alphaproteobacteria bacterium MarineAlpha4_Bin1]
MRTRSTLRSYRRRTNRIRFLTALLVAAAAWGGGFGIFLQIIPRETPQPGRATDAVVVLTGGSLRLETGLALLARGRAAKLFVSGVHRGVDVEELLRISRHSPESLDCCIALGYTADNTRGNARETAAWMMRERFGSLRLVTANYHMPRSLQEFRAAMPDIAIVPHPVFPAHVRLDDWWRWPGTAMLLVSEYHKLLLAGARRLIAADGPVQPAARRT